MSKIITQLEFWLILFALAAVPNWSWFGPKAIPSLGEGWGSVEESRMIVIGLAVAGLAILWAVTVILERSDRISLGFFRAPLNWILAAPLFLSVFSWVRTDFRAYQFFGFGIPWSAAALPVFLLLAWHFLLRSFFTRPRSEASTPRSLLSPEALAKGDGEGGSEDSREPFLKFAFAWLAVFALIALTHGFLSSPPPATLRLARRAGHPLLGEERGPGNIGHWFVLASALALILSALRVPLAAPARTHRFGRFIYPSAIVLLVAIVLFIRFEIRVARAAVAASRNDFASARKFNPYHPLYAIFWVEQEIAGLEKMDLTADVAAAKEKVGEIVKGLEALSRPPSHLWLRSAQAWERLGKFAEGASEKAAAVYDAIIAAQGDNPDDSLIIKKALLLEKAGRVNEAIEWLRQLLSPDRILRSGGKPIGSISGSLTRSPQATGVRDDSAARYHLGRLLYNSGKAEEAAAIWLAILKEDPNYADVNYSLGAYFARQGKAAEALKYFEKVRRLAPDNAEVKKKIDELKSKR